MHTVSAYTFKCHNPSLPGKLHERNAKLSRIGTHDIFNLLRDFFNNQPPDHDIDLENEQTYKFSGFVFNEEERIIYGTISLGHFGIRSNIIDINTKEHKFTKEKNYSEFLNHFVFFYLPLDSVHAIALFHKIRGSGTKTIFHNLFGKYFNL